MPVRQLLRQNCAACSLINVCRGVLVLGGVRLLVAVLILGGVRLLVAVLLLGGVRLMSLSCKVCSFAQFNVRAA